MPHSSSQLAAIILAAGKGTRLKSEIPKVLHRAAGWPLIYFSLHLIKKLHVNPTVLVVEKNSHPIKEALKNFASQPLTFAIQDPPLGTGHAVLQGLKKLKSFKGNILILYGDMPLIKPETIESLLKSHEQTSATLSFVTAHLDPHNPYGRVVRNQNGNPLKVMEVKDATEDEKKNREVNVGIYLVSSDFLAKGLSQIDQNNAQNEYYLTDLIKIAHQENRIMNTVTVDDFMETQGVNTQEELEKVEGYLIQKKLADWMNQGVRVIGRESIYLEQNVTCGTGTTIFGPCFLFGKTVIGKNCVLEPGVFIRNSHLGSEVRIKAYAYLDDATLGQKSQVGPFAHLRPQTILKEEAKVGNFVEVKKSTIGRGSKVNHLSYIGDAKIGSQVNVGAGTITCNYDGKKKHPTILDDGVFVGSDTQFVAPVRVGKNAVIGAGSTITKNVKPYSLALTRAEQKEIKNWVKKKSEKQGIDK